MMSPALHLPVSFIERIEHTYKEQGHEWLKSLPETIKQCMGHYELTLGHVMETLSYNYVITATQKDGEEIIVKFGIPNNELKNEINALVSMGGSGIVNLLESDSENGILLLEKLNPGLTLATIKNDEEATTIAADIMQKIWHPIDASHSFPTSEKWCEDLKKPQSNSIPKKLIDQAIRITEELHQSMGKKVLLHGDLHHFNILSATREPWLAIDPKGVISEREFEVGALLRNPIPDIAIRMNTKKVLANRIDQLSELLSFDRKRVLGWGFSLSVLASIWSHGKNSQQFLHCAHALESLLN